MAQVSERTKLGHTELQVTRLGLGTASLGFLPPQAELAQAGPTIIRARELGIVLFDTAPLYGEGQAESRLGTILPSWPRDSFVIATKAGYLLTGAQPTMPADPRDWVPPEPPKDYGYDAIMRGVDASLRRLGLDHLDIVHIHDPDDHFEAVMNGAYPALERLRSQGVIRAIGAGMNQAGMLARLARAADFDCFLLAGRYTLLDQRGLPELLPLCAEKAISVIIGGVFNSGILAKPYAATPTFNYRPADTAWIAKARRIDAVCREHDVPLKAAALQFPLGHRAVTTVLTGPRSLANLEENVAMFEFPIAAAFWDDLRAAGLLGPEVPLPPSV
jgi:D-threo-aldose 1-dehydrogenase